MQFLPDVALVSGWTRADIVDQLNDLGVEFFMLFFFSIPERYFKNKFGKAITDGR